MYNTIKLEESIASIYSCDGEGEIDNLSRINIFIGPNNSGKSRLLRALFLQVEPQFRVNEVDIRRIRKASDTLLDSVSVDLLKSNNINPTLLKIKENDYLTNSIDFGPFFKELDTLQNLAHALINSYATEYGTSGVLLKECISSCKRELEKSGINNFKRELYFRDHIYIPTLRGLRSPFRNNGEQNNAYLQRTINDYFRDKDVATKIYTGLGLYEDVKRMLLSVSQDRKKVRDFEDFLSKTFFERKEVSIVPHIDSDVVYVKIGEEDDRPIYDLGEGIQSIIILTYPLFFNQGKHVNFFFEEPDLFLHPGYQRIFMETLNDERFRSFQYFFTTHSNHFLDMTLDFTDTSVYAFHRKDDSHFSVTNVKNSDKDLLQALGVRNSSVFLSNCTIWVEGITDRIYIRKYLEVLFREEGKKVFKEDVHFSFVEYGGNNITHWSFLENEDKDHANIEVSTLCGTLFLISDSDGARGLKKQKRFDQLKENLGDNFYLLQAREIENLLTPDVLINTIKELEKDDRSSIDFKRIKNGNYTQQSLGSYIEDKVSGVRRKYAAKSGTISGKVQFAKIACGHIRNIDDLSTEALAIVKKLYDFIKKNNE
jgi:AAA15 family ATPase/GTPase